MVAALAEHGRYLHAFGDAGNSNWRSMQYNGLATTALTMPELNNAAAWYAHAESNILEDMQSGVYPDGVEDEETSHYHGASVLGYWVGERRIFHHYLFLSASRMVLPQDHSTDRGVTFAGVALESFDGFYKMTQQAGVAPDPRMAKIIASMFNYVAYTLDSAGISAPCHTFRVDREQESPPV